MWSRLTEYAENIAEIVAPTEQLSDDENDATHNHSGNINTDRDEQEKYISELEGALLQHKKQIVELEKKIKESQNTNHHGAVSELILVEKNKEIHRLQHLVEDLLQQQANSTKRDQEVQKDENLKSSAEMIRNMEKRIFAMDRRIETLVKLCDRLQQEKNGPCDTDTSGATSTDIEKNKYFAQLIQVSLLLSSVTGNDNYDMSLLDTDGEVVESLLTQAGQVKELSDQLENDLRLLLNSITSFLRLNDEKMDIKSCTGNRDEIIRSIQSKLGALSHKYSKSHEQGVELIQWKKKCSILQERECTTFEEINRLENQLKVFQNSTQDEQNAQVDKILAQLEDAEKRNKALKNSEREYITKIEEYERGYLDLLAEMEELKQKNLMEEDALLSKATLDAKSMEQQHIYDLESKLTNCEADRQVAIQDANRLQKEVDNLENVLEQFQKEKKIQRDMISSLQDQLSQIKQAKIDAMNEIDKLKQKDDEVSKTAYEAIETELIKKSNECERLREALENSAQKYQSNSEVLDKQLAAQLVVSYCQGSNKVEMLDLISRMMNFSEEQKRQVGLLRGNSNGLFSSIFTSTSDDKAIQRRSSGNLDGKTFTDVWTEFLLDEVDRRI